VIFIVSAALII